MGNKKKIDEIKIRINHVDKLQFARLCSASNKTTSEVLRDFIESQLEKEL